MDDALSVPDMGIYRVVEGAPPAFERPLQVNRVIVECPTLAAQAYVLREMSRLNLPTISGTIIGEKVLPPDVLGIVEIPAGGTEAFFNSLPPLHQLFLIGDFQILRSSVIWNERMLLNAGAEPTELAKAVIDFCDITGAIDARRPGYEAASRSLLADRITAIAEGLEALRINAATESIEALRGFSDELRTGRHVTDHITQHELEAAADKLLMLLGEAYDAIGGRQGVRVLIAGGVGAILGMIGWPAVVGYGLIQSAYFGKEAFLKAIEHTRSVRQTKRKTVAGGSIKTDPNR